MSDARTSGDAHPTETERARAQVIWAGRGAEKMKRKVYERELAKLKVELVKLQGWIKHEGLRVAVIFEGRDFVPSAYP